jgi:hypothetical protein
MRLLKPYIFLLLGACSIDAVVLNTLDQGMQKSEYTPSSFEMKPPDGPEHYVQGWRDGCESGVASTNQLVKPQFQSYFYRMHPGLAQNPIYYRVWRDAYDYCAFSMLTLIHLNNEKNQ